jgi:hypothetical protein
MVIKKNKSKNNAVFDDGSEWTLFRGFNTCESNARVVKNKNKTKYNILMRKIGENK